MRRAQLAVKHGIDRVASVAALVVLSPILGVIAFLLRRQDGGPALFRQQRPGRNGVLFEVVKFRTMIVDADRVGLGLNIARHDQRITRVGKVLRDYSLDELPQLINVARGEMSLVGPRPGLVDQAARYDAYQRRRLAMKPGLTGWAQVHGRNAITWEERIRLDVWYVEHFSLWVDLRILLRTPIVVLRREGLFGEGGANYDLGGEQGAKLDETR